jgi:hypothetical protein
MWPPMWTRKAAFGLRRAALFSKSANDMQRSSRLQSTNCTWAPARMAASGVAMNVFEGQSTVSPRTSAKSSAASAPPLQLDSATAGSPSCASQACSKRSVNGPSDHRPESMTSSISAWRRARSRGSNPIAKRAKSGGVLVEAVVIDEAGLATAICAPATASYDS